MKVLAWIEETAKRSLTRFGAASLWGLALFLLLSYLNLWEKDHIDLLAVLFALGNGALSSVVIKIFLEIKNRKVMPLIYLFPGVIFYGLFSLYQAKSYLILGGLGLAAALTGLLVFLLSTEKRGKSAFPPVFLAALESSGLYFICPGAGGPRLSISAFSWPGGICSSRKFLRSMRKSSYRPWRAKC